MVVAFNTDANVNLKSDFAIEKKDVAQNQLGSRKFKAQNTLVESYANAKLEKLENKVDEKIKETENQSSWSRVYDAYLQAKKDIESGKAPLAVIRNLWDLNNTLLGEFHYSYSRLDLAVPDSDTKAAGDLWRTVMSIKNSPASALSILDERIAYVSNEVLKNQPQLVRTNRTRPRFLR